jgi:hypothetical protein
MKVINYIALIITTLFMTINLTYSQTKSEPETAKNPATYVFPFVGQYSLKIENYPEITNSMLQIDSIDNNILKGKVEINLETGDTPKTISGEIKGKISKKEIILFLVRFPDNNNKKIIFKMKLTTDSSGYKVFKGKCKISEEGNKKLIKNVLATPLFQQPSTGPIILKPKDEIKD